MTEDVDLKKLFPRTNEVLAQILFAIEVGLRELIIRKLSDIDGEKWHAKLPPDVLEKYVRGKRQERSACWTNHIEHHPIYYVDFPDLAKILSSKNCWDPVFRGIFQDKDVFLKKLKSLEPIRNKLAHNRLITDEDCSTAEAVLTALQCAIGKSHFHDLVSERTAAPAIIDALDKLYEEVDAATANMTALERPINLYQWDEANEAWWFEASFLTSKNFASKLEVSQSKLEKLQKETEKVESEIQALKKAMAATKHTSSPDVTEPIRQFFDMYHHYASLPRNLGTGHKIEEWVSNSNYQSLSEIAVDALRKLKDGLHNG